MYVETPSSRYIRVALIHIPQCGGYLASGEQKAHFQVEYVLMLRDKFDTITILLLCFVWYRLAAVHAPLLQCTAQLATQGTVSSLLYDVLR